MKWNNSYEIVLFEECKNWKVPGQVHQVSLPPVIHRNMWWMWTEVHDKKSKPGNYSSLLSYSLTVLYTFFPVFCWPDPVNGGHSAPLTTCFAWLHDRCINLVKSLAFDLKVAEEGGSHRQHWVTMGFSWGKKPQKKCSCKLWRNVMWVRLFQCLLSGKLLVFNPTCATCTAIMSSDSGNVTFPFKSPGV